MKTNTATWAIALIVGMVLVPFAFRHYEPPPTPPIPAQSISPPLALHPFQDCQPLPEVSDTDQARIRLAHYLFNAALDWMKISLHCVMGCGGGLDSGQTCYSPPICQGRSPAFDPKREQESLSDVIDRVFAVADQTASIALRSDPVPFHRTPAAPDDDDRDRHRTGLLLMSIAFYESRFRGYVDDGRCNDPVWRALPAAKPLLVLGGCDGGLARSLWQLHGFHGPREAAIAEALSRARAGFRAGVGLRWYTGESVSRGSTPKSWAREHLAYEWAKLHPFAEWSCGNDDPTNCSPIGFVIVQDEAKAL